MIFIITMMFLISCHEDVPIRVVTTLNEKFLIESRKDFGKPSLIQYYKDFYGKAFRLNTIEESEYPQEIRIYFEHSFGHTAFRQRFSQSDTMYADLDLGFIEISNDSVYMLHDTNIKTFGKYKYDNSLKLSALNLDSMIVDSKRKDAGVLDNIAVWFIQIKTGSKVRNILVNSGLEEIRDMQVRKEVKDLISKISHNFSFVFTANELNDSMFRRPYKSFR